MSTPSQAAAAAELYRQIPSVDEALRQVAVAAPGVPHRVLVGEIRQLQDAWRQHLRQHGQLPAGNFVAALADSLNALQLPSLRPVINATGVILHTNLGRAPLGAQPPIAGYSNLEFDLAEGQRGKRDVHAGGWLQRILGQPGIVVNNNAAATYLVLRALAAGREVIISRGELIEIGDGFRIPEIMEQAGVVLREVGTTNRTHLRDYEQAFSESTALIVRVHASNFHMQGFTGRPELAELCALAHAHGVPVYDDLGSGNLVDLSSAGVEEPLAGESLAAGADIVSFSADKLLGGPQAGLIAGRADLVSRIRQNPMYRAFRPGKQIIESLETTLRLLYLEQYDQIPTLRMVRLPLAEIEARARHFAQSLPGLPFRIEPGESKIGGGSTPAQSLPTRLLLLPHPHAAEAAKQLRQCAPPVLCRIERDCLVFDLRTVFPHEEESLATALQTLGEAAMQSEIGGAGR